MVISCNVHILSWAIYFESIVFKENIMPHNMKTIVKSGVELKMLACSAFQFLQLMHNALF